jgi:hypothetical protein
MYCCRNVDLSLLLRLQDLKFNVGLGDVIGYNKIILGQYLELILKTGFRVKVWLCPGPESPSVVYISPVSFRNEISFILGMGIAYIYYS